MTLLTVAVATTIASLHFELGHPAAVADLADVADHEVEGAARVLLLIVRGARHQPPEEVGVVEVPKSGTSQRGNTCSRLRFRVSPQNTQAICAA